ncbi:MAG: exodeoxyribonuclease VII small subunit [Sphaerochaetaceae bacterium]
MGFEHDLARVQEITEKLNDPNTELDESLKLYDEGIKLSKSLEKQLLEAKRKVQMASGSIAEGLSISDIDEEQTNK